MAAGNAQPNLTTLTTTSGSGSATACEPTQSMSTSDINMSTTVIEANIVHHDTDSGMGFDCDFESSQLYTPSKEVAVVSSQSWCSKITNFLAKIYDGICLLQTTTKECLEILKLIAQKHRVKTNPILLEYGSYASIVNGQLVVDKDAIQAALARCHNIEQVISYLPFIGLTENEDKVVCEFCPSTELAFYRDRNRTSHCFANCKKIILSHVNSDRHRKAVLEDFRSNEEDREILTKDKKAGIAVFRVVYGGMKMGNSLQKIIREFCMLQFNGVVIGNINHSASTVRKIKDVLASVLRGRLRVTLATPLDATGKKRPVSELFDKMTHFSKTGQMQLSIVPLVNDYELLTAVYLDNYLVDPDANKYEDMVNLVRETGNSYYLPDQVENGSADGAYAKSDNTRKFYADSLEIKNEWVQLKWDYAHQVNLAEDDAKKKSDVETEMDKAQELTKVFRWGKEYLRVIGRPDIMCVSLTGMFSALTTMYADK